MSNIRYGAKAAFNGMRVNCHQPWEAMVPLDGHSRWCAACSKAVTDFTDWEEAALKAHFARHPEACGLFRVEQVLPGARPLPDVTRELLRGAVTALAALSLATASAQTGSPGPPPTEQVPVGQPAHDRAIGAARQADDDRCWAPKEDTGVRLTAEKSRPRYYLSWRFPFVHRARMVRGRIRITGCPSF